jgi:glucan phosphorylase
MELAVHPAMPIQRRLGSWPATPCGPPPILGVDAGRDSFASERLFHQNLDASGWQQEAPTDWKVENFVTELPQRITVALEDRRFTSAPGNTRSKACPRRGPRILPDADLPENSDWDRTLTHYLYGGDSYYPFARSHPRH